MLPASFLLAIAKITPSMHNKKYSADSSHESHVPWRKARGRGCVFHEHADGSEALACVKECKDWQAEIDLIIMRADVYAPSVRLV